MGDNPIDGFTVDPKDIQYIGRDLQRPECILAERDGTLWSADARGGVVKIAPDHMLAAMGTIAPWTASITFGGPDLKTVYVGSLRGTRIPHFPSPVAGLPMVHW